MSAPVAGKLKAWKKTTADSISSHGGPIPRTIEITVSDGKLFAEPKGRGKVQLVAQSDTTFLGFYGLGIRFIPESDGTVTYLAEMHVSGDYRFIRVK